MKRDSASYDNKHEGDVDMTERKTTDWMKRNKLKAITVYFHEVVFNRVEALAKEDQRSKGNWVHNLVIERLRKAPFNNR
jgi:hypothetical protein